MIICNCNAISDKDIKKAAKYSGGSIKNCFNALNKKPNCGNCFNGIQNILDDANAEYVAAEKFKKSVA